MKAVTLLIAGCSGIVLFTIVLPEVLAMLLAGHLLVGSAGGVAWLVGVRLAGELVVWTIPGRGLNWF